MIHNHSRNHHAVSNLKAAFFLNFGFAIAEFVGGYAFNSIAIMSDALHDLGDSITLAFSWRMETLAKKRKDDVFSYGYRRFSLLSALINAFVLIGGSIYILATAMTRLSSPQKPDANGMLGFALLGIAVNGIAALRTSAGKTMNEKLVSWHLIEDLMGWIAVLIMAVVLKITPLYILDPVLSILMTAWILINVFKNLRATSRLFLQGVPEKVDIVKIEKAILNKKNVKGIHHTHVWSLDGEQHVLTTHIVLDSCTKKEDIRAVKQLVKGFTQEFDLAHTTIEFEYSEEDCSMNSQAG